MAYELPDLDRLTLAEEETSKPTQKAYTYQGSGKDRDGNHFCLRDYGPNTKNKYPYHYSNKDGSYGYSNPDGSKYHNDGQERSWYELVPGVNLFRDGSDGKWIKLSVNGQPGMSSAGFEKVQAMIGQGSSATRKYSQPESDSCGTRRSDVDDIAHWDDDVTVGSSRSFSPQRRAYDDGDCVRECSGSDNEANSDCYADDTRYCGGGCGGGDMGEYEKDGCGGYGGWSGNNTGYSNDTEHENNNEYDNTPAYGSDDTGYGDTYNDPNSDPAYGPDFDDYGYDNDDDDYY